MTTVRPTPELLRVAKRMVWFKPAEETLGDPVLFLCHVMTYGTHQDLKVVRNLFSEEDLREALKQAYPGIFDPRSWSFWHLILGVQPTPPLPTRRLPD